MDVYAQIVEKIITQQEAIIGAVAIERAQTIEGLQVDWSKHAVSITAQDKVGVIEKLIEQYKELFGQISVEVCREAAAPLLSGLSPEQIPQLLK